MSSSMNQVRSPVRLTVAGFLRHALGGGMGLTLLASSIALPARAGTPPPHFGTSAWFVQKAAASAAAASAPAGAAPAADGKGPAGVTTPAQATALMQQSLLDFAAASNAVRQQLASQAAARAAAAATSSTVPDGLVEGGLQLARPDEVSVGPVTQGIKDVSQSVSGAQTTVTVTQEAPAALMTWSSFNVGAHTTLDFDQSAGTQTNGSNSWVVLNRVLGTGKPSQILGNIKADGSVYVINQNGFLFGGTSQVNTHSFLASTLSLFSTDVAQSNAQFLNQGLLAAGSQYQTILTGDGSAGEIRVERGAQITSGELGFLLLDAPHVYNDGTLSATDGQIIVAASPGLNVRPPDAGGQNMLTDLPQLHGTPDSDYTLSNTGLIQSVRGNISLLGLNVEQYGVVEATTSVTRPGSIIIAAQNGSKVSTDLPTGPHTGVLEFGSDSVTAILPEEDGQTTTSSDAAGAPFEKGGSALPTLTLTGGSVTFQGSSDGKPGALVEAPGATIDVAAIADGFYYPSLPHAAPAGRVFVDNGAVLDVAGMADVQLPVSARLVTIGPLTQNDLADSPLLKDGFLYTSTVTVDSTLSGTTPDGRSWVGSPIINAAPYVQNIPRTIDQLLTNGGTVNLAGAEVMTAQGSSVNLAGGYINYVGGMTRGTTRLLGADGHVYDIGSADPTLTYTGFAQQTVTSTRWNQSSTYGSPLLTGALQSYMPGFVQGGNGGALNIQIGGAVSGSEVSVKGTAILDGGITTSVVAGRNQVASKAPPQGASFSIGGAQGSSPAYYTTTTQYGPSFDIGSSAPTLQSLADAAGLARFAPDTPLGGSRSDGGDRSNLQYWTPLNAAALSADGFSSISVSSPRGLIVVEEGAALSVNPAGALTSGAHDQIALTAGAITINGRLTAPSGSISAVTTGTAGAEFAGLPAGAQVSGDLQVGAQAVLDTRGVWVNDSGRSADEIIGSTFINGGSISLTTQQMSYQAPGGSSPIVDNTGSINLAPGSTLDVSSGGYVSPTGKVLMSGNVPAGAGGSISLLTYDGSAGVFGSLNNTVPPQLPTSGMPQAGSLNIAGANILGYGFSAGGSLTLQSLWLQIGGTDAGGAAVVAPSTQDGRLYLPAGFFEGTGQFKDPGSGLVTTVGGFGSYTLNAEYDASIAGGSHVNIAPQSLIPRYDALMKLSTGADVRASGAATPGVLDAYDSKPGTFTLTAGDYRNWFSNRADYTSLGVPGLLEIAAGASLTAPAQTRIVLGSPGTVDVEGSVTSPGGSIVIDGLSGLRELPSQGYVATVPAQTVELGEQAKLDVSGTTLLNPFATPVVINGRRVVPDSGTVLPGGSIAMYGTQVAAAPGSVLDVSGTTAVLDVPQNVSNAGALLPGVYAPVQQWSDAGQITVGAADSLYLESTLRAQPGSSSAGQGRGGTLTITALNSAGTVELYQSADSLPAGSPLTLPAGWQPGDAIASGAGTLYLGAGGLDDAGIWNLALNSDTSPSFATNNVKGAGPLTVAFAGNVDLSLRESFSANAIGYRALAAPGDMDNAPTTVKIAAPYVQLEGDYYIQNNLPFPPAVQVGSSTLSIGNLDPAAGPVTQLIDLGGSFSLRGFSEADFASAGGIRFLTQSSFDNVKTTAQAGELYTPGNLRFTAQALYPASGNSFLILAGGGTDASGQPLKTTVDIEPAPGTAQVPLSAGGSLLIDASAIVQNGTLWAPGGSIVLGVGDPADTAVQARLGSSLLVATGSVTLGAGSTTSVSLGDAVIPYGTTVDGQEWQYNSNPYQIYADLTAPPAKLIDINAASITLQGATGSQAAATIDLSGGGTLQAQEWVPGVGGTRDVLSRFNTSYANSTSGTPVPLYPDQRGIYALLPSYEAPVAAYDPVLMQGQAPLMPGQAITISGGQGIPAGTYVLMPAKYATLPGAFRVVQRTGIIDTVPARNAVLADGTQLISGYFSNTLTGARESRSVLFELQSTDKGVWQQYSQYNFTSADAFFPRIAATAGTAIPPLPQDAGQLILGASGSLTLGATLDTSAAEGGALAEVDIASLNIQVTGPGATALPGYLQISTADLSNLGAGSLLLGGTRTQTASGVQLNPLAQAVVVSNDASSPLTGNQILLVATDTVQVDAGSVIQAAPSSTPAPGQPLSIGDAAVPGSGNGALLMVSSGGPTSLSRAASTGSGTLRVGAGAELDGGGFLLLDSAGDTIVDSSARLGGRAITADAGAITFVPGASQDIPGMVIGPATLALFSGASQVTLRSYGTIDFEGDEHISVGSAAGDSFELSAAAFTAGAYGNSGSQVSLSAPTLILTNEQGLNAQTSVTPVRGSTALTLTGSEIDLGSAAGTNPVLFSGFSSVNMAASPGTSGSPAGVVTRNGTFNFGAVDVSIAAPVVLVAGGSNTTLTTTGALNLAQAAGAALEADQGVGGQLSLTAGTVTDTATLEAPAGNLVLTATSGDVHIGSGALLSVAGVGRQFFDIYEYAPAGNISLTSQKGHVQVDGASGSVPAATLDFSGASGGGDAGSLTVNAPQGVASLSGTLKSGVASAAYVGGSILLRVGGAEDLDSLAQVLSGSGALESLSVVSGLADQGTQPDDLVLSAGHSLTAHNVSLVADHGSVLIIGSIDADGATGGSIALYGTRGVDVEGSLTSRGGTGRGGQVMLGTSAAWDPQTGSLNSQYGYESLDPSASGTLTLGSSALIDVTGAGGGGTVSFRAPLLSNGDVNVQVASAARIAGAGKVTVEPYAVWSTSDPKGNPAQHFDGYVDPAGWYDSSGHLVNGTFYNQDGVAVASGSNLCPDPAACTYLTQDFFVPATANADHQSFYGYLNGDPAQGPGTLMGFIQAPGFGASFQARMAGIAAIAGGGQGFAVTPGVELDNPVSAGVNGGNIAVLSNWNLGAGALNADGTPQYVYRYSGTSLVNGGAPVLTLRAGNNLVIDASLSDGFHQYNPGPELTYSAAQYASDLALFGTLTITPAMGTNVSINLGSGVTSYNVGGVPGYVAVAAPAPGQSADYYAEYVNYRTRAQSWSATLGTLGTTYPYTILPANIGAGAPRVSGYPATKDGYAKYLSDYAQWLTATYPNAAALKALGTTPPPPELPPVLPITQSSDAYGTYLAAWASYASRVNTLDGGSIFGTRTGTTFAYIFPPLPPPMSQAPLNAAVGQGNAPANVATPQNIAPLAYAAVSGGDSSSYRLVAGADLSSANPLALGSASDFASGGGSVMLAGHTAVMDEMSNRELVFPTSIRTGSGSIAVAAAGDIVLADPVAPGVVYTAGVPVAGSSAAALATVRTDPGTRSGQEFIVAPPVNAAGGGDISLVAQNDIRGIEQVLDDLTASLDGGTSGQITGTAGRNIGQAWWQWMQTGNTASASSINFSAFDQGLLSVGGNVSVTAGGDIADLSVSLPTTWRISSDAAGNPSVLTYGGGSLTVSAGNDIRSGSYFVSGGTGSIRAGGSITSDVNLPASGGSPAARVSILLGLQNAQLTVNARGGVDLGGIFDPSYLAGGFDSQGYGTNSSVSILSVGGDVQLSTLSQPTAFFSLPFSSFVGNAVLPASLSATALQGGISIQAGGALYPSPTGQLSLVAQGDIDLYNITGLPTQTLQMIDAAPESMPSPLAPITLNGSSGQASTFLFCNDVCLVNAASVDVFKFHQPVALHAFDTTPARIYSLDGSIVDGVIADNGFNVGSLLLRTDKQTFIQAGGDIVNLNFNGQNLLESDVTRIVAGRDIYDTPLPARFDSSSLPKVVPALQLGGPGTFDIEAGRNIGPLSNQGEAVTKGYASTGIGATPITTGIDTVGNLYNPYLPHESASINVMFGVGPGIATGDFIARYIGDTQSATPGVGAIPGVPDYTQALIDFMNRYENGLSYTYSDGLLSDHVSTVSLDAVQAWAAFKQLPVYVQNLFVGQVFDDILARTGTAYHDPSSPYFHQYARGYEAINTLFPASLGYTANNLTGGTNGAQTPVTTGNLDLRSSTIQTQQGGSISLFGPGGQALLGSDNAPPYFVDGANHILAGPNTIGLLTLEQGDINIFTDRSVLLAQSRVFTEQGGSILMWSSNGDINAGNGLQSTSFLPPLQYTCNLYNYCIIEPAGQVTGAGIATLQTVPGAPPGDVELITPRGTVDAGQAGIRVSGNLTIAALHVANVFNIQVQGTEVGVPRSTVDSGALSNASSASTAALQAEGLRQPPAPADTQVTVEVVGYGSPDEEEQKKMKQGGRPR